MNLLVIEVDDFIADDRVRLTGRRCKHVLDVHRVELGSELKVGRVNGPMGRGKVVVLDEAALELQVEWTHQGRPSPPICLAVAMCRPPTLRKVMRYATSMGVERFLFFHSRRVEKSYWNSRELEPEALQENLWLGMEQGCSTQLPVLEFHRRFLSFVQDRLVACAERGPVYFCDPSADEPSPFRCSEGRLQPVTMVVGPEGGFIPFELETLAQAGHRPVNLGSRILRVEVAVIAALARLGMA